MGNRVWKEGTWFSVTISLSLIICFNLLTIIGILGKIEIIDFILLNKYHAIIFYSIIWLFNLILFGRNSKYKKIVEEFDKRKSNIGNAGIVLTLCYYFISCIGGLIILVNLKK
jgi:hypothetical protein